MYINRLRSSMAFLICGIIIANTCCSTADIGELADTTSHFSEEKENSDRTLFNNEVNSNTDIGEKPNEVIEEPNEVIEEPNEVIEEPNEVIEEPNEVVE